MLARNGFQVPVHGGEKPVIDLKGVDLCPQMAGYAPRPAVLAREMIVALAKANALLPIERTG